jgi:hypothetical protein
VSSRPRPPTLEVEHRRIVAGRPQINGCVERVQSTILEECWKPACARHLLPNITRLREELRRYLRYYNTDRAHTGSLDPRSNPRTSHRKSQDMDALTAEERRHHSETGQARCSSTDVGQAAWSRLAGVL